MFAILEVFRGEKGGLVVSYMAPDIENGGIIFGYHTYTEEEYCAFENLIKERGGVSYE